MDTEGVFASSDNGQFRTPLQQGLPAHAQVFALSVVAGAYNFLGPIVAGLMLRGLPALLTEWGVDGNIATIVFGAGLLHALITAPQGISGQLIDLGRYVRARWMRPDGAGAP